MRRSLDPAIRELLQSYRAALEVAEQAIRMAHILIDAHVNHRPLPDATVTDYRAQAERAEQGIARLRTLLASYGREPGVQ